MYRGCRHKLPPPVPVHIYSLYTTDGGSGIWTELSESRQPVACCVGFDPELSPLKDAVFESTVAQRVSVRREDDEGEWLRNRAFVDPREPRDRPRAGVRVVKHAWWGWHPVVDGRLKPAFRDRRLVWDRDMAGRPQLSPAPPTVKKAAGLIRMVGCNVVLDGGTDRRRDSNDSDRPETHTMVSRRHDTVLSAQ